jgi:hypothetical protein
MGNVVGGVVLADYAPVKNCCRLIAMTWDAYFVLESDDEGLP